MLSRVEEWQRRERKQRSTSEISFLVEEQFFLDSTCFVVPVHVLCRLCPLEDKCCLMTFLQAMYETSSEEEGCSEEDGDEAGKLKTSGGIVDVEDMRKVSEVLLACGSLSPACLSCD